MMTWIFSTRCDVARWRGLLWLTVRRACVRTWSVLVVVVARPRRRSLGRRRNPRPRGQEQAYVEPDLVEVSPGVQVRFYDYNEPIFFSDGLYWRENGGVWYSSRVYTGGWGRYEGGVPMRFRSVNVHAYAHYRPAGYVPRHREVVREGEHRDMREPERPAVVNGHENVRVNEHENVRVNEHENVRVNEHENVQVNEHENVHENVNVHENAHATTTTTTKTTTKTTTTTKKPEHH